MKTVLALLLSLLSAGAAYAQSAADYPNKPVKVIVPFAPGGATDVLARLVASYMEKRFKQPFVIENRPGGQTVIGIDATAKSPPDGYTLLVTASNVASEQAVNPDWPIRIERDLTPISVFAGGGYAVIVSTSIPVTNLRELVAYSKANPGKLNQAQAGAISADLEILKYRLGMGPVESVLYKGGPLSVQAIVAGEAQLYGAAVLDVVELNKAGKVRVLLYTERERHPLIPQVPTPREVNLGVDDFEAGFWFALMGPANLPQDITNRLNGAAQEMVKAPEFLEKSNAFGMRTYSYNPAQSRERMNQMIKMLTDAKNAGLKVR